MKNGVYLDFADAIGRVGQHVIEERYGNLFEMYERITDEDPYHVPMRIYPAPHYTMGGLWVDYELMTTIPGLYAAGEANFSDHGANRLGASALMQGLADGYFVLPATIGNYLAPRLGTKPVPTDHPAFQAVEQEARARYDGYLAIGGTRSVDWFHRELGRIMWDHCGMERTAQGLEKALAEIPALHEEFRKDLRVPGGPGVNQIAREGRPGGRLLRAGARSCAGTPSTATRAAAATSGPSTRPRTARRRRDDEQLRLRGGVGVDRRARPASLHKEPLVFDEVHLAVQELQVRTLNLTLEVWRQDGPDDAGRFETIDAPDVIDDMSFLEMLDIVNERLTNEGREPIAFDHDCREGICGTCSLMINGQAHGPQRGTATCQLHMRKFADGDTVVIEPWRAAAFPVIKDLMVDRSAFDRIVEQGGFITAPTGGARDANTIPVPKSVADAAMDAAQCIGCGACVAACPNGAANLFTAAKVAHLNLLPQGQPERYRPGRGHGADRWRSTSAPAPTTASARPPARRASRSTSSRS